MSLAALLDLVGERLQTPIFGLGDLAAAFLYNGGEFLGQGVDLRLRNVLTCKEHMLVESHASFAFPHDVPCRHTWRSPAHSPLWAGLAIARERPTRIPIERRHRSRYRGMPLRRAKRDAVSLQPPTGDAAALIRQSGDGARRIVWDGIGMAGGAGRRCVVA